MFEYGIFFLFAAIAVIFAGVVVLHRNPVVGALSLVASFFALAVMYVLLEAPFLAALQVIVYGGAIMVLFLFVIMLLNLQHEPEEMTRPVQQFLGYFLSAAFAIGLVYYIGKYAVLQLPGTPFAADARVIGITLYESYIFPFEMVSILLLAAIVGALVLSARAVPAAKKRPQAAVLPYTDPAYRPIADPLAGAARSTDAANYPAGGAR
jgi:NADH-quinone oxidoreductase subunit J